jgi:hypothetical protein
MVVFQGQKLFPWLSQIAVNFEEYEFRQLIFGFKSVSAEVTTANTQLGSVIMACNYNVTNPSFTSKIPMMEYESSLSARITDTITFGIECDPTKNGMSAILYITPGNTPQVPLGQDPKTFYLGLFQVAVNQTLATGEVGELWVEYDCVLRKKKLFTALGGNIISAGITASNSVQSTRVNLFGKGPRFVSYSNIFGSILNPSSTPLIVYCINKLASDVDNVTQQQARTRTWDDNEAESFRLVVCQGNPGNAGQTAIGVFALYLLFPDSYIGNLSTGFDISNFVGGFNGLNTTTVNHISQSAIDQNLSGALKTGVATSLKFRTPNVLIDSISQHQFYISQLSLTP